MSTTLILTRHAETVWHAENRYTGSSDVPLTNLGRRQAVDLARWAGGARLSAIYSSNLSRTKDTAAPATTLTKLPLRTDARLREVDFGRGEGMTKQEMQVAFPDALAAFLRAPARHPFPGGESGVDAISRAMPAVNEILQKHDGGRVLLVIHSTLLRLLITAGIGLDPNRYRQLFPTVGNCALNTLRFDSGGMSLLGFNTPILTKG